jgi:hypothetical protein
MNCGRLDKPDATNTKKSALATRCPEPRQDRLKFNADYRSKAEA